MPKTIQLTQTRTSTITKSRQRLRETIGHAIVSNSNPQYLSIPSLDRILTIDSSSIIISIRLI